MQEESAARPAVLEEGLVKRISEAEAQMASAASAASAELDKVAAAAAADIVARLTGQQAGEDAPLPEAAIARACFMADPVQVQNAPTGAAVEHAGTVKTALVEPDTDRHRPAAVPRSEESRLGTTCVRTDRARGSA